jgi:hypothetical protein
MDQELTKEGIVKETSMYLLNTCTLLFIAALFTKTKLYKQPRCPAIAEWIKKMWHIYTMEFYSVIRKNEIMSFDSKLMQARFRNTKVACFLLYVED